MAPVRRSKARIRRAHTQAAAATKSIPADNKQTTSFSFCVSGRGVWGRASISRPLLPPLPSTSSNPLTLPPTHPPPPLLSDAIGSSLSSNAIGSARAPPRRVCGSSWPSPDPGGVVPCPPAVGSPAAPAACSGPSAGRAARGPTGSGNKGQERHLYMRKGKVETRAICILRILARADRRKGEGHGEEEDGGS